MINVIGLGYIGLPTALMFASKGIEIIGTDINEKTIEVLRKGELTFEEKGLEDLFKSAIKKGIKFTTEYQKTDMYIIAVPTPYVHTSKKVDSKYILSAVESILEVCLENTIIIIESTISPGTIEKQIRPAIENRGFSIGKNINIVHAPERIIPGNLIFELENNSRIIGSDNFLIGEKVKDIYSSFCKSEIILTDIRSAEMSKVVENTYRDVNIAYANELAKICRADNLDVYEIIRLANKHPRVNILQPGPGVGGHCIPVDPWFLVGDYPELTNLVLVSRNINDSMPSFVLGRIQEIMKENNILDFNKIGIYGLTYKENVDDIRESPTLQLIEKIDKKNKYLIKIYDPLVKSKILDQQIMNFEDFIENIEILVIITGHNHIKLQIDLIKNKIIFDTKNIFDFQGIYKL
jgi:UDP-N-acetyl-D-mannosaminuronic acid dehydrogenase